MRGNVRLLSALPNRTLGSELEVASLPWTFASLQVLRPQQRAQSDTSLVQQRLNEINHQGNQIKLPRLTDDCGRTKVRVRPQQPFQLLCSR